MARWNPFFVRLATALCGALLLGVPSGACGAGEAPSSALPAVPRPVIPDRTFKITDYGAVGDGKAMNTPALRKAVEACRMAGGGTVVVPPGRFLTGPFHLASKLNLRLEQGATLLLSNNPGDYVLQGGRYEHCIVADDCHDVAITGPGTIDGQGQPWYDKYRKRKVAGSKRLVPPNLPARPYLVVLSNCTRVLVEDVSLVNSPSFHLAPERCQDVVVERVRITAPADSPNTDGIDPSGRNFLITGCSFDVGDDCIALKPSHRRDPARPACEDFLITDCTFRHGHGMSVGGQTPGGLRRLTVRDCRFEGTAAGIRLKAGRGSGGLVEDLTYENLTMKDVKVAILITSYYPTIPDEPGKDPAQPVNDRTPVWRHIRIRNVTAEGGATAGRILGLPEMSVSDVVLTNVRISAKKGMEIIHARGIKFVDSRIRVSGGAPLVVHDAEVKGLNASGDK